MPYSCVVLELYLILCLTMSYDIIMIVNQKKQLRFF